MLSAAARLCSYDGSLIERQAAPTRRRVARTNHSADFLPSIGEQDHQTNDPAGVVIAARFPNRDQLGGTQHVIPRRRIGRSVGAGDGVAPFPKSRPVCTTRRRARRAGPLPQSGRYARVRPCDGGGDSARVTAVTASGCSARK